MTFKIIKTIIQEGQILFDSEAAKMNIVDGMRDDIVLDIHGAVKVSNAKDGAQIQEIFNELLIEIKMLSNLADKLVKDGKTNLQIIEEIQEVSINFNAVDVRNMKLEQYGTIKAWKRAMIPDAE